MLDALQWADQSSIELLVELMELADVAPIVFVYVFTPEPDAPSWQVKEQAARAFPHRDAEMLLGPLPEQAARELMCSLLSCAETPALVEELVLERTDGNPFFIAKRCCGHLRRAPERRSRFRCRKTEPERRGRHPGRDRLSHGGQQRQFLRRLPATPQGLKGTTAALVAILFALIALDAWLIAKLQPDAGNGRWADTPSEFVGTLTRDPYPMLRVDRGGVIRTYVIVSDEKRGAETALAKFATDASVKLMGYEVERAAVGMIQLAAMEMTPAAAATVADAPWGCGRSTSSCRRTRCSACRSWAGR